MCIAMIANFADQGTQDIFDTVSVKKKIYTKAALKTLHPQFWEKASIILDLLHEARSLKQIADVPRLRFHKLTGKLDGWYAVRVTFSIRIQFQFDEQLGAAYDVQISNHYGD